jgi:hypothetical protein
MRYYCKECSTEFSYHDNNIHVPHICAECEIVSGKSYPLIAIKYETIAQWERRTGKEYPDTAPVYNWYESDYPYGWSGWGIGTHKECLDNNSIVATEIGAPPNNWRPE